MQGVIALPLCVVPCMHCITKLRAALMSSYQRCSLYYPGQSTTGTEEKVYSVLNMANQMISEKGKGGFGKVERGARSWHLKQLKSRIGLYYITNIIFFLLCQ